MNSNGSASRGVPPAPPPRPLVSLITPAYNESGSLRQLYQRFQAGLGGIDWEWIVVDDHSRDATFEVVRQLAAEDPRVRGIRLSRNHGSHAAILCGIHHAIGRCAVVLASDLQDPPEVIPDLLARWREGNQVVWAVRAARHGESASTKGFSRVYYFLMRHLVGIKEMPATGADFFLADESVLSSLRQFRESNISLFALLTWMGFRQTAVDYEKQSRQHGRSGWTLEKKLKLVADSITSFTYLPIRFMSYIGFLVALLGFAYALFLVGHAFYGSPPQGWSSLMVCVLVLGGIQMIMMGVLGEYLWRALAEARGRPPFLIEATTRQAVEAETETRAAGTAQR